MLHPVRILLPSKSIFAVISDANQLIICRRPRVNWLRKSIFIQWFVWVQFNSCHNVQVLIWIRHGFVTWNECICFVCWGLTRYCFSRWKFANKRKSTFGLSSHKRACFLWIVEGKLFCKIQVCCGPYEFMATDGHHGQKR